MMLHMCDVSHLPAAVIICVEMMVPELPGVDCVWACIYLRIVIHACIVHAQQTV
jgi:hypothetical protein